MVTAMMLKTYLEIINKLDGIVFIKRNCQINERRHLKDNEHSNSMEIDWNKNETIVPSLESYELATSMMNSEWMLEKPDNIENWIAVLCPEGKRCCVIAQDNKTKSVNKYGTTLFHFQSLFPYGCHLPNNCPSHRKRTVLDCIYNFKLKKYYILDIIEWMGVPYTDFDAEFRFYFMQSKLSEIPGINEKSLKNMYPFELAPRMRTSELYQQLIDKNHFFRDHIELDGINFYYPESMYTSGDSPLMLWLKVFMVPEILQKPINDQLEQLYRPSNYVNIFEYIQNTKKKNRKNRRKKSTFSSCDTMEIDSLIEVELEEEDTAIGSILEDTNDMCMEN